MKLKHLYEEVSPVTRWIIQYGGKEYPLFSLPQPGKNALRVYFEDEHGASKPPPKTRFMYVVVPVEELKNAIMQSGEMDNFSNFEEYHQWYLKSGENLGDMPNHKGVDYALIISTMEPTVIYDGWHRFHDYCSKGG